MANAYKVYIKSAVDDGTNIWVEMSIFNGSSTSQSVYPVFPHGTSAATIQAYAQVIANTKPTLDGDIGALVGSTITGA